MPQAEPLPVVGPRCGAIRVRDSGHNWRIVYRVDDDAVVVVEIYAKKTRTIPQEVIKRSRARLIRYDAIATLAVKKDAGKRPSKNNPH